jgi:WbqC-like protein family
VSKRVAIVQSSYIPWKGYFDLIRHVDEFILFDDVQFTKRDWRNRNRIKTPRGPLWLSIPVQVKGRYLQAIKDTVVSDPAWSRMHWQTIRSNYAKAPFFPQFKDALEDLFLGCDHASLSEVNYRFTAGLCRMLGIGTRLSWSMSYVVSPGKTERLVSLCRQAGATQYVSGPAARSYIDPVRFEEAGITLSFFDYAGYPEYRQLYPPFDHFVSVIDLILHTGADAPAYMLPCDTPIVRQE